MLHFQRSGDRKAMSVTANHSRGGSIPSLTSISLSRGEVGEHNGLIHRHFAGSSPAATTIFVLSEFAYIVVF